MSQLLLTMWVSKVLGWCPGLSRVLVSIAFPFAFQTWCFPFTLLHLPLDFIRVSSLRPTYRHPFGRPFTYSLFRLISRLVTGSDTRCCGSRGGAGFSVWVVYHSPNPLPRWPTGQWGPGLLVAGLCSPSHLSVVGHLQGLMRVAVPTANLLHPGREAAVCPRLLIRRETPAYLAANLYI